MIPLPWKIFRVANWVQLIYTLVLIAFLANKFLQNSFGDNLFFILSIVFFVVIVCNNYVNLYIFGRYFPDRSIPRTLEKINTVLFIIGLLLSVALVIVVIAGSMEEFKEENRYSYSGKLALLIFFLILLNLIYILWMQLKMHNMIKRGHYLSMNRIINSIGHDQASNLTE